MKLKINLLLIDNNNQLLKNGILVSDKERDLEKLIIKLLQEKNSQTNYLSKISSVIGIALDYITEDLRHVFEYLISYIPYSRSYTDKLIEELEINETKNNEELKNYINNLVLDIIKKCSDENLFHNIHKIDDINNLERGENLLRKQIYEEEKKKRKPTIIK